MMAGLSETDALNGYLPARWYEYFCSIEIDAIDRCTDQKQWRQVFFTQSDAERMAE
jgi:hypothetical protein